MVGLRDGLIVTAFLVCGTALVIAGEPWWGVFLLIPGLVAGWGQLGEKGE